jgi:hypothetical protein
MRNRRPYPTIDRLYGEIRWGMAIEADAIGRRRVATSCSGTSVRERSRERQRILPLTDAVAPGASSG